MESKYKVQKWQYDSKSNMVRMVRNDKTVNGKKWWGIKVIYTIVRNGRMVKNIIVFVFGIL